MITALLTMAGVYVAIGIAIVLTINYGLVKESGSRVRGIRYMAPLAFAWPAVLYVLWAFKQR